MCSLELPLQLSTLSLGLGDHRAQQVFRKGALPAQGLDYFRFEHIQLGGGLAVFRPDALAQAFPLLHLLRVADVDNLALGDRFHALKNLAHQLVDDTVQNVGGVACLPVAVRLLAGLAVADIPHPLDDPVRIFLAGIGLAAGGEGEPGSTMAAVHIPRQERLARNIAGNGALCFVGPVGADVLGGLEQLRGNDL